MLISLCLYTQLFYYLSKMYLLPPRRRLAGSRWRQVEVSQVEVSQVEVEVGGGEPGGGGGRWRLARWMWM